MAQGDISLAINELVKKLQVNTGASMTTRTEIERYVNEVIDVYGDAIEKRKEAYRWDVKKDNISSYLKKIRKNSEDLFDERAKRREEIELISRQINKYKELENKAIRENNSAMSKALFQRRVELEVEKNVKDAMNDVSSTAETATKSGNPYLAAIIVAGGVVIDIAKAIARIGLSILKIGFGYIKDMFGADFGLSAIWELFLKMQSTVGNVSANVGLIGQESIRFIENMPRIYNEVLDVGGSIEDIGAVVEKLSEVTNKNTVFDGPGFKRIIELGLGTGLGVENATELIGNFQNLGYSMDKTLEFTDFVREKSMKTSMNQTKVLNKVNELVVSLTGFGITSGLKSMTKLVIDTQRLRLNITDSVNNFKDAFTNPETAVEVAANVKLLGGKFAFYFGDPFKLMAKSMYEPQELTAELLEALKDTAFKGKNGFQIDPADRQIITEFAKSIGQDNPDELINVAIEQAKFADKLTALGKVGGFIPSRFTDEQKILLTNLMSLNEDGSYSIRLSNGSKKLLTEIPSVNIIYKELAQERKNEKSALLRKTLAERIGIAIERFNVGFSQFFVVLDRYFRNSNIMEKLDELFKKVAVEEGDYFSNLLSPSGPIGAWLKNGSKTINAFADRLINIWTNPEDSILEVVSKSLNVLLEGFDQYMLSPMKYYFGRLLELIGSGIETGSAGILSGRGIAKAGLELQKKALKGTGKGGMFYNSQKSGLDERINNFNTKYGDNMSGVNMKAGAKIIEGSAHIITKSMSTKLAAKSIAKRVPFLGLAIGIFDAVNQAIEGDYDQAAIALGSGVLSTIPGVGTVASIGLDATNAYMDASRGDTHVSTDDLLVRANGDTLMGSKGDALLFFNEMILGKSIANAKPKEINLILTGRVSHVKKNKLLSLSNKKLDKTLELSSAMIIEKTITNLENSAL